ncbi:MAG: hypothetical protein ABJN04_12430 [Hyphomicrobiales bacterium]
MNHLGFLLALVFLFANPTSAFSDVRKYSKEQCLVDNAPVVNNVVQTTEGITITRMQIGLIYIAAHSRICGLPFKVDVSKLTSFWQNYTTVAGCGVGTEAFHSMDDKYKLFVEQTFNGIEKTDIPQLQIAFDVSDEKLNKTEHCNETKRNHTFFFDCVANNKNCRPYDEILGR